jgi:hypothetical protein
LPVLVAAMALLIASSQPAHAMSWWERMLCKLRTGGTVSCGDPPAVWRTAPCAKPDSLPQSAPAPPPTNVKLVPKWLVARTG